MAAAEASAASNDDQPFALLIIDPQVYIHTFPFTTFLSFSDGATHTHRPLLFLLAPFFFLG